jgi:uncharacterized protein with FMN-binding domain
MKRLIVSIVVIAAFAFYAIFSRGGGATVQTAVDGEVFVQTSSSGSTASTAAGGTADDQSGTAQTSTTSPTAGPSTPQDAAAQSQTTTTTASGYKDGTYTGSEADAMYGTVQVQIVVEGGQITQVDFLSYPSGRHESDSINNRAMPVLAQEAISAQSAQVQVVSGATLTSMAFMESLQAALDQAQA